MKLSTINHFLAAFCTILLLTACGEDDNSQQESVEKAPQAEKEVSVTTEHPKTEHVKTIHITGKVSFKPMEGGFYAIDGDDGKHYLPLNLPDNARKGGIKVSVTAILKLNVVTIYNYGTPIEIQTIDIIDNNPEPDNTM